MIEFIEAIGYCLVDSEGKIIEILEPILKRKNK